MSVMMIEGSGNGKNNEKPSYPKTDWHGDYLAYLGQKSQSHYVSKVDFKKWHKDLKMFASLLFKPQWEHGHPTYL